MVSSALFLALPYLFMLRMKFVVYMLVYIDDIIIIGNNTKFLSTFKSSLADTFSLKDIGNLNFFLGLEVISTKEGLFLSQHKYILDILDLTMMTGAKESATALSTSISLHLFDVSNVANVEQFRKIIGALQYLCLTQPNINFVVNKLSQFMHKPTSIHFQCLKGFYAISRAVYFMVCSLSNLLAFIYKCSSILIGLETMMIGLSLQPILFILVVTWSDEDLKNKKQWLDPHWI